MTCYLCKSPVVRGKKVTICVECKSVTLYKPCDTVKELEKDIKKVKERIDSGSWK